MSMVIKIYIVTNYILFQYILHCALFTVVNFACNIDISQLKPKKANYEYKVLCVTMVIKMYLLTNNCTILFLTDLVRRESIFRKYNENDRNYAYMYV